MLSLFFPKRISGTLAHSSLYLMLNTKCIHLVIIRLQPTFWCERSRDSNFKLFILLAGATSACTSTEQTPYYTSHMTDTQLVVVATDPRNEREIQMTFPVLAGTQDVGRPRFGQRALVRRTYRYVFHVMCHMRTFHSHYCELLSGALGIN